MANYQNDSGRIIHNAFGGTSTGQTPIVNNKYSTAAVIPAGTVGKRCSYVMINQTGSYAFSYDSGSATVAIAAHNYQSASVTTGDVCGDITPFKLDINPIAWRRTDATGAVGEVTFVYVRVR